jgi:hypothetical protein
MSFEIHITLAEDREAARMMQEAMRTELERQKPRHKQSKKIRDEMDDVADAESAATSSLNMDKKGAPPPIPVTDEDVSEEAAPSLPKKTPAKKAKAKKGFGK